MSLSREQMLAEMGIAPLWVLRQPAVAAEDAAPPADVAAKLAGEPAGVVEKAVAETAEGAHGGWQELAAAVAACRLCPLC